MELKELLKTRRSVRKYDPDKKVTKEVLTEIVRGAQFAPSWKNLQPVRYHCILEPEKLKEFREKCLPEFNANSTAGAAALVVATFVKGESGFSLKTKEAENELGDGWGCYDCGLGNAYFVLKAKELGLDTLIMGIRDQDAIRSLLSIPEEEIIGPVLAVGYAAEEPAFRPRKEVEEIICFEE